MDDTGLEPVTSTMSTWRSNQTELSDPGGAGIMKAQLGEVKQSTCPVPKSKPVETNRKLGPASYSQPYSLAFRIDRIDSIAHDGIRFLP